MQILITMLLFVGFVGDRITYRDKQGKIVASSVTRDSKTVYRDARGSIFGTATASKYQTTYRDATGKFIGSARMRGHK